MTQTTPSALVTIVVFGASGDLTRRKLVPALHSLTCGGQLSPATQVVGVARTELSDEAFRSQLYDGVLEYARLKPNPHLREMWPRFAQRYTYLAGSYDAPETYRRLAQRLARLDADAAGDQATLRGLAVAREALDHEIVPVPTPRGLIRYESRLDANISIITLPRGQDPDDVIRESPERWAQLVSQALPVVDYYFQVVTADLDLTTAKGKAEARRRLMEIIREIGDRVEQTHYVQKLARLIRVSEEILWRDLAGRRSRRKVPARPASPTPEEASEELPPISFGVEEHCLSVLLRRPYLISRLNQALADVGEDLLQGDEFTHVENRAIFDALIARGDAGTVDVKALRDGLEAALLPRFDALLKGPIGEPPLDDDQAVPDLMVGVLRMRQRRLRALIQELRFLSEDAMTRGDVKVEEYGETMRAYTLALRRIHQALASRSTLWRQADAA
ncbi:MAG TPA: hypothetical protein EYP77_07485 [Anaerolineae bacterium]|nr:hypothetical protein [Anaerolineae bacterium]